MVGMSPLGVMHLLFAICMNEVKALLEGRSDKSQSSFCASGQSAVRLRQQQSTARQVAFGRLGVLGLGQSSVLGRPTK